MVFSAYRTTSKYGYRTHPVTGKRRSFHAGIDLVKLKGGTNAPIEAFTDGTVIFAGMGQSGSGLGGYGNVVLVKDSKGHGHVYAHLQSVSMRKGQSVKKGHVIGRQGATGNVTGAHLHYEIRKNTSPSYGWTSNPENSTYDPTDYLTNYKTKGSGRVIEKLKVDGKRGSKTIKRWQQFCGTKVDGFISDVSPLIKAWQRFLNKYGGAKLKVDGVEGPKTIKATQKFFGTTQDGIISPISPMVKALQTFLNSYGQ